MMEQWYDITSIDSTIRCKQLEIVLDRSYIFCFKIHILEIFFQWARATAANVQKEISQDGKLKTSYISFEMI